MPSIEPMSPESMSPESVDSMPVGTRRHSSRWGGRPVPVGAPAIHLSDLFRLSRNDRIGEILGLLIFTVLQHGIRHPNRALMVRDHLVDELPIEGIGGLSAAMSMSMPIIESLIPMLALSQILS